MKIMHVLALASVTGIITGTVGTTIFAAKAAAWHPKGVIKKYVINQTAGGELSDADTEAAAVAAKPGDTLKYVIEIRNDGTQGVMNEMHGTKLTDSLPAGVELVSDASKRDIIEDLGVIKPGEKITKEYVVKVTAAKDGLIKNQACFTGDSEAKDNPQKGCDSAVVKVSVPKEETPPPTPPTPPTPPQPQVQNSSTNLPQTGASDFIAPAAAFIAGGGAYAARLVTLKRRQQ